MVWSGLRGAVGLVLAIVVDEDDNVDQRIGSHFMFHIGGVAMLTILINAVLCAPLLRLLGLTQPDLVEEHIAAHFSDKVRQHALEGMEAVKEELLGGLGSESERHEVETLLGAHDHCGGEMESQDSQLCTYRAAFLRFVRNQYWEFIEEGLIPRNGKVARVLTVSTTHTLLDTSRELWDWQFIVHETTSFMRYSKTSEFIQTTWLLNRLPFLTSIFPTPWSAELSKAYLALCFVRAHRTARDELPEFFAGGLSQEVLDLVGTESRVQTEDAAAFLERLDQLAVSKGRTRMFAGKMMYLQQQKATSLEALGVMDEKVAGRILHHLQQDFRKVVGGSMVQPAFASRTPRLDGGRASVARSSMVQRSSIVSR
mmetsp:Transcript_36294/g.82011  ORF Transcript_36294/g.82011 Transcript_36294/m.82011 type:complete len:369 (+) Transcript_36294:30-1136(+)